MVTVKDAARELHVSYTTVWRLIRKGLITAVKIGGVWRIGEDELLRVKKEGVS